MARLFIAAIAACLVSLPVLADNLLEDPGFATGINPPWSVSVTPSGVSWDMTDEGGDPGSGSLLFVDVGEFGALVSQCVEVAGAAVSRAEYSYFIPDDVFPVFFAPTLFLIYYDSPLCGGTALGQDDVLPPNPLVQNSWTRVEAPVNLPAGTQSLSFGIFFGASGSSNNRSFLDNVLLGDPPLFNDRFEMMAPP